MRLTRGSLERVALGKGGEFDLIRRLLGREEPLPPGVLLGPGDDCAVLDGGVVISTDLALEGVHFKREWITLEEVGYRAAAGALSDLAAVAAEPLGALLSMALDPSRPLDEASSIQRGVADACKMEGIQVLGGDLARSAGPLVLNVVALGRTDSPVLRVGTEIGDEVWVTGWLGGSGAAVELWNQNKAPPDGLRGAFARPRPRIREARWLASRAPLHALIDLSDGLAGDAGHLAAASGVGIVLREGSIPFHPELIGVMGSQHAACDLSLTGGEDYELCFTVSAKTLDEWVGPFQDSFGVPLTRVGRAVEGGGVSLETVEGEVRALERGGFNHFLTEEDG